MKKLNTKILAQKVTSTRKEKHLSQQQLSLLTGINRAVISRLEQGNYIPLIPQLEKLGEVLGFDPISMFEEEAATAVSKTFHAPLNIAVAGNRLCWFIAGHLTCAT